MKIAVVTDDGKTISQHFGRALYYAVLTVEDGKITGREQREKYAHHHGPGEHQHEGHQGAEATNAHGQMVQPLSDCQAMITRGMGYGAYASVQQAGVTPVITDVADIDEAVLQYARGELVNHAERLH